MRVGKIFDNTPSGKALKKKRDAAMSICIDNGHNMNLGYLRVENKNENYLQWNCIKCEQSLIMDFILGEERGTALQFKCRGSSWL